MNRLGGKDGSVEQVIAEIKNLLMLEMSICV
jgi:hypothetical protein